MEEGDALEMKITINLRKEEAAAGSLNLTMGNIQILLLHRVLRLIQMYFSPLDLKKVSGRILSTLHWVIGPSLKVLQNKEKHIGVKIKMDGPTLILPEQKENQDLFSIYLGQVSLENMMIKEGAVENMMLVMAGGQVTRAVMNVNQCIEQLDLGHHSPDIACYEIVHNCHNSQKGHDEDGESKRGG